MVCFGGKPAVKGLIHNIHSQSVTRVKQSAACRVMCASYSIIAGLFHNANAPFFRLGKTAGSQNSVVVVDTPAAQLDRVAVHTQAVLRTPRQSADTERKFFLVIRRFDHTGIQVRMLSIP